MQTFIYTSVLRMRSAHPIHPSIQIPETKNLRAIDRRFISGRGCDIDIAAELLTLPNYLFAVRSDAEKERIVAAFYAITVFWRDNTRGRWVQRASERACLRCPILRRCPKIYWLSCSMPVHFKVPDQLDGWVTVTDRASHGIVTQLAEQTTLDSFRFICPRGKKNDPQQHQIPGHVLASTASHIVSRWHAKAN